MPKSTISNILSKCQREMGHGSNSDGDIDRTFNEDMVRTASGDMVRPRKQIFCLRTWFDQEYFYESFTLLMHFRLEQKKGAEGLRYQIPLDVRSIIKLDNYPSSEILPYHVKTYIICS